MTAASAPPVQWQDVPEDLLEAVFILLPPCALRRARLVCQRWCLLATAQAVRAKVQPHVLDMQHEPLLWAQQLSAGDKILPQLESMQVRLSSRVPEAVADAHLAQLSVFTNLSELTFMHIIGNPSLAESHDTLCPYQPLHPHIGPAWPLPLQGLQHLPSLQRLTLQTTNVPSPSQLMALSHLASLTHLAMQQQNVLGSLVAKRHLQVLAALLRLRSLELNFSSEREMSGEETEAVYDISTLVQLEALKVTLHSECQSATGLLDVVLTPLTRLTLLELGPLLDTAEGLTLELWRYVEGLPESVMQQPAGTPGRPLLRLVLHVYDKRNGDEGSEDIDEDDELQSVLNTLGPQVDHLRLRCDFQQGTSPAILGTLAHPSVSEHRCTLWPASVSRPGGWVLFLPGDYTAVASKLALMPKVSSLALRPTFTDDELVALASTCSRLTKLRAACCSTGCPLLAAACQDGYVLSSLRKLDLVGSEVPNGVGPAAGEAGSSSTSRHLTLQLGMLPRQLRSLKLRLAELDTTAPDQFDGGVTSAEGLQEATLAQCLLTGDGICGLLQLAPALKLLHMSEVRFNGAIQYEAAELLAADSLTSLTVNQCEYDDEDIPEEEAGLRGYEWMCSLTNLRHLEWSRGTWIWRLLPEVLPHLPKLHSLQVGEVDNLPLIEGDLRRMMQATPLADFIAPKLRPNEKPRAQVWL